MFSLAGMPPLAGFFAKWYVFLAAIDAGLYVLAVIGVLASVVGAYYYLRIVKLMWFDEPAGSFVPMAGRTQAGARRFRRLRACSTCCSAARSARWPKPPQEPSSRRWPSRWLRRPRRTATGSKRIDECRLHQRAGARACAGRRSRQAVGRRHAAGQRPGPPRPRLGHAVGQSRSDAADRRQPSISACGDAGLRCRAVAGGRTQRRGAEPPHRHRTGWRQGATDAAGSN